MILSSPCGKIEKQEGADQACSRNDQHGSGQIPEQPPVIHGEYQEQIHEGVGGHAEHHVERGPTQSDQTGLLRID